MIFNDLTKSKFTEVVRKVSINTGLFFGGHQKKRGDTTIIFKFQNALLGVFKWPVSVRNMNRLDKFPT